MTVHYFDKNYHINTLKEKFQNATFNLTIANLDYDTDLTSREMGVKVFSYVWNRLDDEQKAFLDDAYLRYQETFESEEEHKLGHEKLWIFNRNYQIPLKSIADESRIQDLDNQHVFHVNTSNPQWYRRIYILLKVLHKKYGLNFIHEVSFTLNKK